MKTNQFYHKWDFLCLVLCHHLYWFSHLSMPFQGPKKADQDDRLKLLDFVGYYLCKLIVHHCLLLLRGMDGLAFCTIVLHPKRGKNKKSLTWGGCKDYLLWGKMKNWWNIKISTIFLNKTSNNLPLMDQKRKIKTKYLGLSQFEGNFSFLSPLMFDKYFPLCNRACERALISNIFYSVLLVFVRHNYVFILLCCDRSFLTTQKGTHCSHLHTSHFVRKKN